MRRSVTAARASRWARLGAIWQALLEIGAASIPLLFLQARMRPITAPAQDPLHRDLGWLVFAALLYATSVATLGQGIY